jgi:hypothetical protein
VLEKSSETHARLQQRIDELDAELAEPSVARQKSAAAVDEALRAIEVQGDTRTAATEDHTEALARLKREPKDAADLHAAELRSQVLASPVPLFSCACSRNKRALALGSTAGALPVRDLDAACDCTEEPIDAHSAGIASLAFNPAGTMIVTASHDSLLRMWSHPAIVCVASVQAAEAELWFVRYRPTGKIMLALAGHNVARLCQGDRPARRAFTMEAPAGSSLCGGGFMAVAEPSGRRRSNRRDRRLLSRERKRGR